MPYQVKDYIINYKIILAMQQVGCGQTGASILGGMLSICNNPFGNTWTPIEEEIGRSQIVLRNTILDENVSKEKEISEKEDKGCYVFCVSIDADWNNRGSVKSYNSDWGHHITVGNRCGPVPHVKVLF
jgi:hypothetical protein